MADRTRIVTISGGTATTVLDLEDGATYQKVRDSLEVIPGPKRRVMAESDRRFGGSTQVAESHENATFKGQWLVTGATHDAVAQNVEAILRQAESAPGERFIEWRPEGMTASVHIPIRGTADWKPAYRWVSFNGARVLPVEISWPVAPSGQGLPVGVALYPDGVATDYDTEVLADSPSLFWNTISTATATDASGNGRNGTTSGSPTTTVASPVTESDGDTGLDLDGTNDYITSPYSPFVNATTRTFEGWAWRDTTTTGDILFGGSTANGPILNCVAATSDVLWRPDATTPSGTEVIWAAALPATGQWFHWALIFNETADTVELFINGASKGSLASTGAYHASPGNYQAGANSAGSNPFDGRVAKPAVYEGALSAARIQAHYDARGQLSMPITAPARIKLAAIKGSAPALCEITVTPSGGAAAPIFALIGWARRPGTPLSGSVAPFGIIEAETGTALSTWAVTADTDYRGGSGLQATASGAGSAAAEFVVDPSVVMPDDFRVRDLALEVWARVELASTLVSPKLTLSVRPNAGTSFGAERYTDEWGSQGKLLTLPSSGTRFRFVRLGVLPLASDPAEQLKWNIRLAASWSAGSSGIIGLDYLALVPATRRALSPTGKVNDSSYPKFVASTTATEKTIRTDLSGLVAQAAQNAHPDHGLGGSVLELPTGNVDLVVKLSSLVPGDPTSDATTEQLAHATDVAVTVTPRYHLLNG